MKKITTYILEKLALNKNTSDYEMSMSFKDWRDFISHDLGATIVWAGTNYWYITPDMDNMGLKFEIYVEKGKEDSWSAVCSNNDTFEKKKGYITFFIRGKNYFVSENNFNKNEEEENFLFTKNNAEQIVNTLMEIDNNG